MLSNRFTSNNPKMKVRILLLSFALLSIFLVSGILLAIPRAYGFANGQNASVVIGFTNFTSRNVTQPPTSSTLSSPAGLTFDSSGNLWIADASNGRVLEFKSPFSSGESASTVLGANDFVSSNSLSSPSQSNMPEPYGIAFDSSGNLWVSDALANRITEYKAPLSNNENASLVLGQANFTGGNNPDIVPTQSNLNSPRGITFDSTGNLWVADSGWNRVVEFKAPFSMGESESVVIGQTNFTSQYNIPGCPQSCSATITQTALNGPAAVAFDSSGNLWVADPHNGRVLKYSSPISTGESPNLALGVADFTSKPFCVETYATASCLDFPDYLAFDKSGTLWVNDDTNGRVLGFPQPFSMNESATQVIGQPNFTTAVSVAGQFNATQSNMYGNDGIALDPSGNLWVSDGLNNRALEFLAATTGSSSSTSSAGVSSTSSSTTSSSAVSTSSISVATTSPSLSATSSVATTTSVVAPPPTTAATTTSSSSSTSISLNYAAVVLVVIAVIASLGIFSRNRGRSERTT
ncbi:MAG: NHL repeat-containing protein [Nitrososphaerales archaeon]